MLERRDIPVYHGFNRGNEMVLGRSPPSLVVAREWIKGGVTAVTNLYYMIEGAEII